MNDPLKSNTRDSKFNFITFAQGRNMLVTVTSDKYCTSAFGKRYSASFGFVERYLCPTLPFLGTANA